jgi:hypothetical protein
MHLKTKRDGLLTQISVGSGKPELTVDIPRGGVIELLPGRTSGVNRLLVRSHGGAVLSEHAVPDDESRSAAVLRAV